MIARIWRGETKASRADEYLTYLQRTGVPGYSSTPGNRGVYILRRLRNGTAEFVLISLWDSMDAIRGFAGDDVDRAVYYPEDRDFLLALEPNVAHYDVIPGLSPKAHAAPRGRPRRGRVGRHKR